MEKRRVVIALAVMFLVGLAWGAQAFAAADCGEPLSPPTYQVGEKWTWRDGKGAQWSHEVVGVEGDFTKIRWNSGNVASYDKDRILRQVQKRSGELVTQQSPEYQDLGQKSLDFPLQVGKRWDYSYLPGLSGVQTWGPTRFRRFKIVACEEIAMPGGKFSAFKVEVEQGAPGGPRFGNPNSGIYYLWYAPQVKQYVKLQYVASRWWSGSEQDNELVSFELK